MDIAPLVPWLGAISLMLSVGTAIYTMFTGGAKRNAVDIQKIVGDLAKHDRRIQTVEGELKHLPSKESVYQLQVALTEMKGQITSMAKSSEATERATRRVEEFLLSRKD